MATITYKGLPYEQSARTMGAFDADAAIDAAVAEGRDAVALAAMLGDSGSEPDEDLIDSMGRGFVLACARCSESLWDTRGLAWCRAYNRAYRAQARRRARALAQAVAS